MSSTPTLRSILENIDLFALAPHDDKLKECRYFLELLRNEPDRSKFRWLLNAFLNACYGYLEYKAAYLHYARVSPETGEPIIDSDNLEIIKKHVTVCKYKKSGFIKTTGLTELMQSLYKYRAQGTHDGGIDIMQCGDDLPNDFQIGQQRGEGLPAMPFCDEVINFLEDLEMELES